MKRAAKVELRPEYDFAAMKGDVRGKYAERYKDGSNLVLDVGAVFHNDREVNDALRTLIRIARTNRGVCNTPLQR
jgi:hypothetical protein